MNTPKKPVIPATAIDQPYSRVFINKGEALDHAVMRAKQLVDLLSVLGGEGPDPLMWLAQQIADEMVVLVKLVDADAANGGAA